MNIPITAREIFFEPAFLATLFGAVIVVISAWFTTRDKLKADKMSDQTLITVVDANKKLDTASTKLLEANAVLTIVNDKQDLLARSNYKIIDMQDELIREQAENRRLSKELLSYETGDGNRPRLIPSVGNEEAPVAGMMLVNDSKYSIKGIKVEVVNLVFLPQMEKLTPFERGKLMKENTRFKELGTIGKNQATDLFSSKMEGVTELKLRINISWDNGNSWGVITFVKQADGQITVAKFEQDTP